MIVTKRCFPIFSFPPIQLAFTPQDTAENKGWLATFKDNVSETWQQPGYYDLYVPVITWHTCFTYDKEKTDRYNERPWGMDFGQPRWDDKGNWYGLYIAALKDSYNKWEPIGGYGWEETWRPLADENFHTDLDLTVGFTAHNSWNYIPVPVLLPLASIGYDLAAFQVTYIPGTYDNGNVYFAWTHFQF